MKKNLKTLFIIILAVVTVLTLTACRGASAYELAQRAGYTGTEDQWLESLKGKSGEDGRDFNVGYTAYQLYEEAVADGGFSGTFLDFIAQYFGTAYSGGAEAAVNEAVFSVVSVYCRFPVSSGRFSTQTYYASSAGSGVIYSLDKNTGDALIITNYHVVYNSSSLTSDKIASEINVFLFGNEITGGAISCTFVGGTSQYDLALLRVSGSSIIKSSSAKAATFADSDELRLGEAVVAIGNPEAGGISVTRGILSVESETITLSDVSGDTNKIRVLRHDAAVNPGNSGGGLFNADGKLIGIVNAKTVTDGVDDMNYAIPSNTVAAVVKGLVTYCLDKNNKTFYRPYIGVTIGVTASEGRFNAERNCAEIVETVVAETVASGSLAYGKIQAGDKFTSVSYGGKTKTITRSYQIIDVVISLFVGDEVTFTVVRSGATYEIPITITSSSITAVA